MQYQWWQSAIGYQIYPSTFYDSNNDGVGDLPGIIEKLPYLKSLGVNLLWISPFFKSPMDDNGYDVSDYYHINPMFGQDEDIQLLIDQVHQQGMYIIFDLVLNQTSDEHPWFIESRSNPNSDKRDYYIWQPPRYDEHGQMMEPNNWSSFFDDSAWAYDDVAKQYYLKIFSKKMPDINWANPQAREAMYVMARYWLDHGVDGFRLDAIAHLAKDMSFTDSTLPVGRNGFAPDWQKFSNRPQLFEYLREFKQQVLQHYDCVSVGEVGGGAPVSMAIDYAGYQAGSMNMVFTFDHCWENGIFGNEKIQPEQIVTNVVSLKKVFWKWYSTLNGKAWPALYWLNHDHPRVVSQYGDEHEYHQPSAKALCNVLYFMPGTPFVYQGEEIGMTNVDYTKVEDFQDVWVKNYATKALERISYQQLIYFLQRTSRCNARTPMHWSSKIHAGFSSVQPQVKVVKNYLTINVEDQTNDPNSILNHYTQVFAWRKQYANLILNGDYTILDMDHPDIFAYTRSDQQHTLLVIANLHPTITNHTIDTTSYTMLTNNYPTWEPTQLQPFQSVVMIKTTNQ
jgi:glycosidase